MRSLVLVCLAASICLAQAGSSGPAVVGAGFSNPFPLPVAPGQLLTLFVQPGAGYNSSSPLPTVSAVFTIGSLNETMPILEVSQTNNSCSGGCPSLLAVTVQVPFDAPITPAVGLDIAIEPSGIIVSVNGVPIPAISALASADHVHLVTMCDVLVAGAASAQSGNGQPCAPMITHANGAPVSVNSPATSGEELVAYATGLGQTTPSLTTGQPAAASNSTVTAYNLDFNYRPNALATKPSQTAPVPLFAGATKGYIGLYQVNFIVPPPPAGLAPCALSGVSPDFVSGDFVSGVFSNLTVSVGSIFSFDGAGICVQPSA
jgi:uncharacterized protein (TIGR03437 family)